MIDDDRYDDVIGPAPSWLHLLSQGQRDWRAKQILKGRDPDPYIEGKLQESGVWPVKDESSNA